MSASAPELGLLDDMKRATDAFEGMRAEVTRAFFSSHALYRPESTRFLKTYIC